MEMEKVPQAGYPIEGLWISGLQRKLTLRNLMFPLKVISSMIKASRLIKAFKPDVVVGVGGYASGPTLKVATKKKIPTLIQEQNSYPGITNKLLGRSVNKICVSYEGMEKYFPASKIIMTGNPVRQDIANLENKKEDAYQYFGLSESKKTLVIIGGSQGARSINNALGPCLESLIRKNIQVVWQTGKYDHEKALDTQGMLESLTGKDLVEQHLRIYAFIDKMDYAYAIANLVLSRAGAIAISELCAVGLPVILVPFPTAAEDHQGKNAQALEKKGAAVVIKDMELKDKLNSTLHELLNDDQRRASMQNEIKKMARTDAVQRITEEILKLMEIKDN
jgi:UDP-N-acetylglucosamine--N-acetylmuramyl-(pentapeptide) pyrophosphoryl-undecaprenol N-acetylglucosamine transferase